MKKIILFLMAAVVSICYVPEQTGKLTAAPSSTSSEGILVPITFDPLWNQISLSPIEFQTLETGPIEKSQTEEDIFREDIPLAYEEQRWLQSACEEFDVPYSLALGLIERETNFRNIVEDDEGSTGYMQIQKRWHYDRMERLGVTDLLNPEGNFRVGLDFLSELYARYNDWSIALTVYNMGHNPGYITKYANAVMENYAHWEEILAN